MLNEQVKNLSDFIELVDRIANDYNIDAHEAHSFVLNYIKDGTEKFVKKESANPVKESLIKDNYGAPIGLVSLENGRVKIEFDVEKLPTKEELKGESISNDEGSDRR